MMSMQTHDQPGKFYLGKLLDPSKQGCSEDRPFFYDANHFTTHAVCIGMTGSGKTGLGIDILEEAALQQIPAIIIDPKGDLGNLLLTFPHLSPEEFLPWIDESEGKKMGLSAEEYAENIAKTWREGLAKWGQGIEKIQKLRNSADIVIYTPASKAGIPLSILSSFSAPSKEFMLDSEAVRDKILSMTSGILGLIGISADPLKSREHILISTLLEKAWNNGQDLTIEKIIQQIQKPPLDKIGALDIDTFFPPKERMALSISLNNLLASPGFQAWTEGEPLDVQQLLYTKERKPKLSIITIAHLSDSERMFFVTLLLNEMIAWMRRQSGTSNLRAILYMDEIFGYFPPIANPPSKIPMLTLLKQARAYGLGVILSTQNPVDLDYKGLSNCGTWFIGKLQTERDKKRVLEGLSTASIGEMDAQTLDKMLALTGKRIFILRSIYEKSILLFETRWTLSYLRGPLTLPQIAQLSQNFERSAIAPQDLKKERERSDLLPPGIKEFFFNSSRGLSPFQPKVLGRAKLHFVDLKNKIDAWQDIAYVSPFNQSSESIEWKDGFVVEDFQDQFDQTPLKGLAFDELPGGLMNEKKYPFFEKSFSSFLFQNQEMTIFRVPRYELISKSNETENEFRVRIAPDLEKLRNEEIKKRQEKYEEKRAQLLEKMKKAQDKMSDKQHKAFWQKIEAGLSFLTTLMGALLGRGVTKGTINQTGTSIRRAGRIGKESQEVEEAQEGYRNYEEQKNDLEKQWEQELREIHQSFNPETISLEEIRIRPKKNDMIIEKMAIAWCPGDQVPN